MSFQATSTTTEVGIFPTSHIVAFPFQTHELQVKEPSQKYLVQRCITNNIPLGLAFAPPKYHHTPTSQYQREPVSGYQRINSVFGVGHVEFKNLMADGHLVVKVHITEKVRLVSIKQHLPFMFGNVKAIHYQPDTITVLQSIRNHLEHFSRSILGQSFANNYFGINWQVLTTQDLLRILARALEWFKIPLETMQEMLATDDLPKAARQLLQIMEMYAQTNPLENAPLVAPTLSPSASVKSLPLADVFYVDFRSREYVAGKHLPNLH